jgi:hypothetical protein
LVEALAGVPRYLREEFWRGAGVSIATSERFRTIQHDRAVAKGHPRGVATMMTPRLSRRLNASRATPTKQEIHMPRFMIERTFPSGLAVPMTAEGSAFTLEPRDEGMRKVELQVAEQDHEPAAALLRLRRVRAVLVGPGELAVV